MRLSQIAVALADELLAQCLPERRLPSRRELAAQRVAEVLKLVVADVLHELRALVEESVADVLCVHRHGERDRPRHRLGAGVSQRSFDRVVDPAVDRADEQHADALSRQEVVHHRRVGELERLLRLLQLAHLSQRRVAITLGVCKLVLRDAQIHLVRDAAAREPDADEDPDDQRDEDRRERRDVVAKVEHAATSLPRSARARGAG